MDRTGLRELKKERTRRTLLLTAHRLFEEKGYEATTIHEIARAAEVSQGTFFNYFATKEALIFGDRADIADAGLTALTRRNPSDHPADAVTRAFEAMLTAEHHGDPDGLEQHRARLIVTVPSLYATALRRLFEIQDAMAARLHAAFPELDRLHAAILVGAFVGAGMAALRTAADGDAPLERAVRTAIHEVDKRFH